MYRKTNKRTILKRTAAIIMILVFVFSNFSPHNTNNMLTVNAKQSQVVFRYGDMQEIKIGAYRIIQEYKKDTEQKKFTIKIKKGNKILLNERVGYALLLEGKLYYAKKNCIYCYHVKKEKNSVLVEMPKIEYKEWYPDVDIFQYYHSYLYYCTDTEDSWQILYRINVKTGKTEELMGCISGAYDFFYKGYTYIPFGNQEISNQSYYRISLKGKKKVKKIISKCANGNVVRYKNKLYYMQFGKINSDTSKVTTYLKCCNLDGSHKKTLKTWKKQTMGVIGITGDVLYFQKAWEYKTLYQYNIKNKKITTTKKYPKVKKIKLTSQKGSCKVTWDRGMASWDNRDAYEISYATNPQFHDEKIKTYDYDDRMSSPIKLKSQVAVIKGLKKGKTYYVRIRAKAGYSGNWIYSPYSKTMKIKIQ